MEMMDMDMEDEECTDAASSPSQEGFVGGGGFGTGSKAGLHPTSSPRSPLGAGSNTRGDSGVAQSRLPERLSWGGRYVTPQVQVPERASAATGKARSRMQCGECGSAIGRWSAVVPSGLSQNGVNMSLGGASCGFCGGHVAVERESEGRLQYWSKPSAATLTTPSLTDKAVERSNNNKGSDKCVGKGNSKGSVNEHRRMPSGTKAPLPVNEDGGNHGDHDGNSPSAKWMSQEAQLPSVAEDEGQAGGARAKQCKRGREEEDSAPATPLLSADSRLARHRRGNELMTSMSLLSWGQSGDDNPSRTSRRPPSGSLSGDRDGGGGGMTAIQLETRSDPPSDPVSKRRKSDRPHGDSSPFKSSVVVAARSKYRVVHHRGFSESGKMVGGSADGATNAGALDEATVKGASGLTTYSPGMSSSSSKTRRDSRCSDLNSTYRRRYRDEYSKNKPRRQQGTTPSPLCKGSREASGTCAGPRTPASTGVVEAADSSVDPAVPLLVVIDGSNVAFSFRQDVSNPRWSPQGILLAVKFFEGRGVPVVAFVPRPRVDTIAPGSEHYDAFMEAMRSQAIATVPSKANDDLFILLYAIQRSAHIVSNDQFRDHLANASTLDSLGLTKDQLRDFLVDHHVSYTFARDEFVANPEAAIIRMLTKQTASVGSEVRRTGPSTL